MATPRDYAVRNSNVNSKKKKNSNSMNKTLLLFTTILIVVGFASALYLLKEKTQAPIIQTTIDKNQPKSQLPSRPEEVWSYIKELESRTVITDDNNGLEQHLQLSEKQKEELRNLEEKEKQALIDKMMQEERKKTEDIVLQQNSDEITEKDESALEAELARIAQLDKTTTAPKNVPTEPVKPNETAKTETPKKINTEKNTQKSENTPTNNINKFGLQCGAFKNKEQAENLKNRLIAAGLNARVNASTDWNRVIAGPMADRAAAAKARQDVSSIIGCVIIGM